MSMFNFNSTWALPLAMCAGFGWVMSLAGIQGARWFFRKWELAGWRREKQFHHDTGDFVPRCGGFGLALLLAAGFFLNVTSVIPVASPTAKSVVVFSLLLFALGGWDDLKPLGAKCKLLGQVVIATWAWWAGLRIEPMMLGPWIISNQSLLAVATIVWLLALPNLINLIDGSDGVAGSLSLLCLALLALMGKSFEVAALAAVTGGGLLAFLAHNLPPARVYLGDGGAYLLGGLLAGLSLVNQSKSHLALALGGPVLVLSLPLADALYAILRRAWKGLPIFRADREHLHHRLRRLGLTRRQVVLVFCGFSIICACLVFILEWSNGESLIQILGLVIVSILVIFRRVSTCSFPNSYAGLRQHWQHRSQTRSALRLSRCLCQAAERSGSRRDLWEAFHQKTRELGFESASITAKEGKLSAYSNGTFLQESQVRLSNGSTMIFQARTERLSAESFRLLAELAAEAWFNAEALLPQKDSDFSKMGVLSWSATAHPITIAPPPMSPSTGWSVRSAILISDR